MVPTAFVVYFWRRRDGLGAAVCLLWVAINCWNIAVYVADAQRQELPLVGGGEHDWAFLLAEADLLRQDQSVARVWKAFGFGLFVISIVTGARGALHPVVIDPDAEEGNLTERVP